VFAAPPPMSLSAEQLLSRALGAQGNGDPVAALADYRRLLILRPDDPAACINGAVAWQALQRPQLASAWCRWGEILVPLLAAAHRVAAENWRLLERADQARLAFRRGLCVDPADIELINNLAILPAAEGVPEPVSLAWHAVRLAPDRAPARANLSALLLAAGQTDEACHQAVVAILLLPAQRDAYNNFANGCFERRDYPAAKTGFLRARRLDPEFVDSCVNESGLRLDLGEAEAGSAIGRLALVLAPQRSDVYNNLGNGELLACRLDRAAATFRRALQLAPLDAQIHFNFAAVLLKQGRMTEGWQHYEWRRRTPAALKRRRSFAPPDWPGGDPRGRTLLLSAEQGLGDALQFSRFVPWLADQGAHILLRTHPPLRRLMGSLAGVAAVFDSDDALPDYDFQLPLMSVPACYALDLPQLPARIPYLSAEPAAVRRWKSRLARLPGAKVGLVWSGDARPGQRSAHLLDRRRSLSLARFSRLAELAGVTLISLQKGPPSAQTAGASLSLVDWTDELQDFADSAALVSALDLVITVDTSVAHLAGALGKPVWILSRFDGCWRWLDGRSDSPWYPSARLFRQPEAGDWESVMDLVQGALADWLVGRS
jgi:tetratricopeptide (TPR) repeat protein